MKRWAALCAALALSCSRAAPAPIFDPTALPSVQATERLALSMIDLPDLPGLDGYHVRFASCAGLVNAWFVAGESEIVVCHEVAAFGPRVMRMFILHEAGHAAFWAGVPYAGLEELAADEYAVVLSLRAGAFEDVAAFAGYWHDQHDATDDGVDGHPAPERRARRAECLASGAGRGPRLGQTVWEYYACRATWRRVNWNWSKLLAVPR